MTTSSSIATLTPHSRTSVARLVQRDIHGVEATIDNALSGGGSLLSRMIDAGQSAKLSPAQGQAAIDRVVAGIVAGRNMRAEFVAAHEELRTITGKVDLREMGWGDLVPSPAMNEDAATAPAVGEAAA
jgi:hypothetical protein